MTKDNLLAIAAILSAAFATPAAACTYPPPPPECSEKFRYDPVGRDACAKKALDDHLTKWKRGTENFHVEQAPVIFFGRVIRSEEIQVGYTPHGRRVVVRPLHALRGKLPEQDQPLVDRHITSCGLSGDGWATSANVSDIVVVFTGVEPRKSPALEKPEPRIFSLLAKNAQNPLLVEAWQQWKQGPKLIRDEATGNSD